MLDRLLQAAARVTAERARHLRTLGLSPSAFAVLAGHRTRYEERQHALVAALSREDQRLLGDLVDRICT